MCAAAYDGGSSWHQLPMLGSLKTTVTLTTPDMRSGHSFDDSLIEETVESALTF